MWRSVRSWMKLSKLMGMERKSKKIVSRDGLRKKRQSLV